MFKRFIKNTFLLVLGVCFGAALLIAGAVCVLVLKTYPELPSLSEVASYRPKIPLRIYTSDGKLIGVYGEERRNFTRIEEFPQVLKNAVVATEDRRFYTHSGVDFKGIARAAYSNYVAGGIRSGASTITQQVARNFYLNPERSYRRKFKEALLAHKIERALSKDQILELYFNQIFLGQRSYGFAAAAQAYYGKPVQQLSLAEAAMLAGLPQAPSTNNPFSNPKGAKRRQLTVLQNMVEEGMITPAQRDEAAAEEIKYKRQVIDVDPNTLYVAEMTRQLMFDRYGEKAYTQGYRVYTTVDSKAQAKATEALRKTLDGNTRNGPYGGAIGQFDLDAGGNQDDVGMARSYLTRFHKAGDLLPAVVLYASPTLMRVAIMGQEGTQQLGPSQFSIARNVIDKPGMKRAVRRGSVVRVRNAGKPDAPRWVIAQEPELQGALVSLDARTGAIQALVGGYDFYAKEFNRATQAMRQPGSTLKPFIYSAALQRGFTASTLVNDAPLTIPHVGKGGRDWSPKNSGNRYSGMITLRAALVASRNVVSVRLLLSMGIDYAADYLQRFGFPASQLPKSYSLALGTASVTPLQMAEAYAVFANGGYKTSSYIIDRIQDDKGRIIAQTKPLIAGANAHLVIDPRNAFIMTTIMQDITRVGTAARASSLKRKDIAGKTGTTNDQKDAWFVGFTPKTVTAVYIGYDKPRNMGSIGFGGRIALPVWIDYMGWALKDVPQYQFEMPKGVIKQGGEYYLAERLRPAADLNLDNSASEPGDDADVYSLEDDLPSGESPIYPAGATPGNLGSMGGPLGSSGSGGRAQGSNLGSMGGSAADALF